MSLRHFNLGDDYHIYIFDYGDHCDWSFDRMRGSVRITLSLWSFSGPTRTHLTRIQRRRAYEAFLALLDGELVPDLGVRILGGGRAIVFHPQAESAILA